MPETKKKSNSPSDPEQNPDSYWETKQKLEKKGKKFFVQQIFEDWCKGFSVLPKFLNRIKHPLRQ